MDFPATSGALDTCDERRPTKPWKDLKLQRTGLIRSSRADVQYLGTGNLCTWRCHRDAFTDLPPHLTESQLVVPFGKPTWTRKKKEKRPNLGGIGPNIKKKRRPKTLPERFCESFQRVAADLGCFGVWV